MKLGSGAMNEFLFCYTSQTLLAFTVFFFTDSKCWLKDIILSLKIMVFVTVDYNMH